MILRQLLDTEPVVAASYLFGCGGKAAGAVVDPVGDPVRYVRAAESLGLSLRFVIDTHVHADHLSSGRELARETGYPTLLAAIGDVAHPGWRGSAVGVYRFWRDLGYAVGALVVGVLADTIGMSRAIVAIGLLTAASGMLVAVRMPETHSGNRE